MFFESRYRNDGITEALWKKDINEIGEKVYTFFADEAINAGYQMRDGQLDMACEIVDGIRDRKNVLVEAGVGIGKSFAYIVPILLYSEKYKKPVVIATSTIALQEQLKGDIENIKRMLGINTEVIIAKGQNHFLCARRADDCFTKQFCTQSDRNQAIYKAVSKEGHEKADWKIEIPDEIWNKINVQEYNPQFCRDKCGYHTSCYYYRLRNNMIDSRGVIVCNQDLLAIDLMKKMQSRNPLISKEIGLIVVDEAHNLESRVRASVTASITLKKIEDAIHRANAAVRASGADITRYVSEANKMMERAFDSLYKQIKQQDIQAMENGVDIERYYITNIDKSFDQLHNALEEINFTISSSFGDFVGNKHRRDNSEIIDEIEDHLGFIYSLTKREKSNDIFWLECTKTCKNVHGIKIYKCPKEVDHIIRGFLTLNATVPFIMTSATLTSGKQQDYEKNYSYFINNIGFPLEKGKICSEKESPFDYDAHAMIYYTEQLPHPTKEREKFIEDGVKQIIKLLEISEGKTLILFTAKTDMQEVYNKLKEVKLPYKVLMQRGNVKQAEILNSFRDDTDSVLLGTGSFWEGINIEGKSLSQVIIFKLPFPIREPIIDYKFSRSKNSLMEVAVPEMVIKLKQGIGRLIRSEDDKGIISIIDSRVGDKSDTPYRSIIWDSLPIKKKTNDLKIIEQFYKEIVKE